MSFPRIAGIAGIAFFVLMVVSTVIQGEPPALDASNDEVIEFVEDDTSTLELANFLAMLGLPLFILLAAGLARAAAPAEGEGRTWSALGLVGAATTVATVTVASGINAVMLTRVGEDSPEVTGLLFDLVNSGFVAAAVLFGIFLVGMGLAIVQGATLPSWLGWAALVIAVPSILGGAAVHDALQNEGLGFIGFIGFIGFVLWNLVASIVLLRSDRAAAPAAAAA